LENLPMVFKKFQSLVELDLFDCLELGCLPDSIVHLSQLKTFDLSWCDKLENLPVEFEKLQSLVELNLSNCSQLGCLLDSIVTCHNSRHLTCLGVTNWKISQWSSRNFKAWWD
jgi:Leucine-rich repeat (LRR) protein